MVIEHVFFFYFSLIVRLIIKTMKTKSVVPEHSVFFMVASCGIMSCFLFLKMSLFHVVFVFLVN